MKRVSSSPLLARTLLALALGAASCGDLDNETTAKDLRVLAVMGEPAGFLVPLDDPGSIMNTQSSLTALVVDAKGQSATLTIAGEACPDYIDTVTAASGMMTKICPGPSALAALPEPLRPLLAPVPFPESMVMPIAASPIQYEPNVTFGLTPTQIGAFFNDPLTNPTGIPTIDLSTGFNREFGFGAIVNLNFALGEERASVIKRVVYWPQLKPEQLPPPAERGQCVYPQVPNQNPKIAALDFYALRVEGNPTGLYQDATPTVAIGTNDLYVNPTYDPASAEYYYLRVRQPEVSNAIVTQCRHELLTFQFYATVGTFSPPSRQSELLPIFTSPDGLVHLDSKWEPPTKPEDLPADTLVTVWVVVRDERAGSSWSSRTFKVTRP